MAVYRRAYLDPKTGQKVETKTWWYEFTFAGQRIRESSRSTRKTFALEAEKRRRLELEKAIVGLGNEARVSRIRRVGEVVKEYLQAYPLNHRPESVRFANSHLGIVKKRLGDSMLSDLTEPRIRQYIAARLGEGVSGRTINMELGELSRAIGRTWRELWPNVRKLEERKDVGRALSDAEERKLLEAAYQSKSRFLGPFVAIALLTGMRSGELFDIRWGCVDLDNELVTVGQAKTRAGTGRQIPMNKDLVRVFREYGAWYEQKIAALKPEHYLFPLRRVGELHDPLTRMKDLTAAWDKARDRAGVQCRFHDLRHTVATKLAEAGVAESTMLALLGHMSRAMLERYSHIRIAAKRSAVESLGIPRVERKPTMASARPSKATTSKAR